MKSFGIRERRHRIVAATLLGTTLVAGTAIAGISAETGKDRAPLSLPGVTRQSGFADLVATVKPAVVNISTTETVKQPQGSQFAPNSEFGSMMRQFFGPDVQRMFRESTRPEHALGSGFIVDPAGYIVTNNHVIDDAQDIQITLTDGTVYPARIVGRDTKTDLALLKIQAPKPLPYLAFGDSDKEQVGDWVIAVGNPYGLGGSVTAGIISANNREINAGPYDDFLQIDAPINPGNSGGPLFDQSGHVIGIDTAIYSPSGGSVGIGFAIPSNVARSVVDQLREHGRVARGWLGIQMQELTPALAKAMGLPRDAGALVDMVTADSPAGRADIRQGDVITALNGVRVANPHDLAIAVAALPAGKTVSVTVWRQGHEHALDVTIGTEHAQKLASDNAGPSGGAVGMSLEPLTPAKRRELGLGETGGVMVAQVTPGSRADESGIEPGDIILNVGGAKVTSPEDAASHIRAAETEHRSELPLLVMRNGTRSYVALPLDAG